MKKYLQLMIDYLPNKSSRVSFEILYQYYDDKSVSFADFKADFIRYMKRKVKKFTIKNSVVTIECYTKAEINELIKYFKIGDETREINLDLLYNSWLNPYDVNKNIFVNKLEKYLISKDFKYFIFDNALHIKEQ